MLPPCRGNRICHGLYAVVLSPNWNENISTPFSIGMGTNWKKMHFILVCHSWYAPFMKCHQLLGTKQTNSIHKICDWVKIAPSEVLETPNSQGISSWLSSSCPQLGDNWIYGMCVASQRQEGAMHSQIPCWLSCSYVTSDVTSNISPHSKIFWIQPWFTGFKLQPSKKETGL